MNDKTTKNVVIVLLLFVIVFSALKSYDNARIERKQKKFEKLSEQTVTVADLLFVYKIAKCESVDADSFFVDTHTPFSVVVKSSKKRKSRSFSSNEIYSNYCSKCHDTGIVGAPKTIPNKQIDSLAMSAYNGIGQMPPKGLCDTCSEEQLKETILWMIKNRKND